MVFRKVNIHEIVDNTVKILELKASEKKISLIKCINEDVPKSFFTDEKRLKQIIYNLVGNSIKYTFNGYVKISLDAV